MPRKHLPEKPLPLMALVRLLLFLLLVWALVLSLYQGNRLEEENRSLQSRLQAQTRTAETAAPPEPEVQQVTLQTWRGENAVDIYATVTLPAATQRGETKGLVVMCHGFTGDRTGDGHFAPLARRLAQNGITSIALDFSGNGQSQEPFTAYTLEHMTQDVEAAIRYMNSHYPVGDKLGLLGHSMGGRLVTLMLDDTVDAAALWSPANRTGLESLEFLSHDSEELEALRQEVRRNGSVELSGWNVSIGEDFVEEMLRRDPLENLESYQGALLIAFAGGDTELLSQQTIDDTLATAARRGKNFVNLYGQFVDATHNYTASSEDPASDRAVRERIEARTADFFIQAFASQKDA